MPLENLDTQANVVNRDTETSKPKDAVVVAALPENNKEELYYAQPIKNGFQLVNAEPKIVMILLETSAEQVFIVKGKSAIVYEKDGFWYYSENSDVLKKKQLINIKF